MSLDDSGLLGHQPSNGQDASSVDEVDRLNMAQRFGFGSEMLYRRHSLDQIDRTSLSSAVSQSHTDISLLRHDGFGSTNSLCVASNVGNRQYPRSLKQRYVLKSTDGRRCVGGQSSRQKFSAWKPGGTAVRDLSGAIPQAAAVPQHLKKRTQNKERRLDLNGQVCGESEKTDNGESADKCDLQTDGVPVAMSVLDHRDSLQDTRVANVLNESPTAHSDLLRGNQEVSSSVNIHSEQDLTSISLSRFVLHSLQATGTLLIHLNHCTSV